jgi:chromosome partitioning protein
VAYRLAIANQKGGVGKTTTVLALADQLQQRGLRVLVIDLDPQGNATTGLGITLADEQPTVYDLIAKLNRGQASSASVPAPGLWEYEDAPAVHVIPSDIATRDFESGDMGIATEMRLRAALDDGGDADFDVVLIDCPPSLGKLVINGLIVAHDVILVTEPSPFSFDGLAQINATLEQVRQAANPTLGVAGIVFSRAPHPMTVEARTIISEITAEVPEAFTVLVTTKKTIPVSQSANVPLRMVVESDDDPAYLAYRGLADHVTDLMPTRSF